MSAWIGPRDRVRLPKTIGFDAELGNAFEEGDDPDGSGPRAARALLAEIRGVPARGPGHDSDQADGSPRGPRTVPGAGGPAAGNGGTYDTDPGGAHGGDGPVARDDEEDPQDLDRRFLRENGGCAYIDLGHLELAAPEVSSALDHVASWHAMLRIAARARDDANRGRPPGRRIRVLVNNSDGAGHSYGSHLSLQVSRRAWDNLFERRLHYLLWLAGFQVSSVIWSGQGKVGAENGAPPATFQLAQRADFFERLTGPQTTWARPIVNSRDEPLCGPGARRGGQGARLHVIFFDNVLSHVACLLRAGTMQIVLAMIEADAVESGWLLEDPLAALRAFSRDPGCTALARCCDGRRLTALELQRRYFARARHFVSVGGLEDTVPRAEEIMTCWDETLTLLERRDHAALARRLDWALKLAVLERARAARPGLDWEHPALKTLDLLYGSLDPGEGIYLGCERDGHVERRVGEERIRRFETRPPDDTRAWTRAMLLRRHGREVEQVDWDVIRVRAGIPGLATWRRTLSLPDPVGGGRLAAGPCFDRAWDLDSLIDALEEASRPAAAEEGTRHA